MWNYVPPGAAGQIRTRAAGSAARLVLVKADPPGQVKHPAFTLRVSWATNRIANEVRSIVVYDITSSQWTR